MNGRAECSTWSEDEEEVDAQRAMEEWVNEVDRLLGGTSRRAASAASTPSRSVSRSEFPAELSPVRTPTCARLSRSPGRKISAPSVNKTSPPLAFTPQRSAPTPPVTTSNSPVTPTKASDMLPMVPWRKYQSPATDEARASAGKPSPVSPIILSAKALPPSKPPPLAPLPERPLVHDVPVDTDDDEARSPEVLPQPAPALTSLYFHQLDACVPMRIVRPASVCSQACTVCDCDAPM